MCLPNIPHTDHHCANPKQTHPTTNAERVSICRVFPQTASVIARLDWATEHPGRCLFDGRRSPDQLRRGGWQHRGANLTEKCSNPFALMATIESNPSKEIGSTRAATRARIGA